MCLLPNKKMFFSIDCEVHGDFDHEIEFCDYKPAEHEVVAKCTCLACYDRAKHGDKTYPYVLYHFDVREWNSIVMQLNGISTLNSN